MAFRIHAVIDPPIAPLHGRVPVNGPHPAWNSGAATLCISRRAVACCPAAKDPWAGTRNRPCGRAPSRRLVGGNGMTTQAVPKETGARLTFDGKSVDLPMIRGTEDEVGVDIQKLRTATGLITRDPGYGNSGSCRSAITFIDGERGILRYRGYPIEELAEKSSFLEVAWLLIHGELPTRTQLSGFAHEITRHTMLHENFVRFF